MAAVLGGCRATPQLRSTTLHRNQSTIARARYIGVDFGTSGARAAVIE